MKHAIVFLCVLAVSACASSDRTKVVDAAATPLTDLNLIHPDIPRVLKMTERAPFAAPVDQGCPALAAEMRTLDEALGYDVEGPNDDDDRSHLERGAVEASKATVKAIESVAKDVVPFRKWVRKLTGAERRSEDLADAIAAGYARRAFLRGFALAKACEETQVATATAP